MVADWSFKYPGVLGAVARTNYCTVISAGVTTKFVVVVVVVATVWVLLAATNLLTYTNYHGHHYDCYRYCSSNSYTPLTTTINMLLLLLLPKP